jgi:hypothetical protein
MNGKTHPARFLTKALQSSLLSSSLNIMAERHARELMRSTRPGGQVAKRLTQSVGLFVDELYGAGMGGRCESSAYFQTVERRKEMSTLGSALHRSDIPVGRAVTDKTYFSLSVVLGTAADAVVLTTS